MITAQEVMKLRKLTGYSVMDCKKALLKSNGNAKKAVEILRQEFNFKISPLNFLGESTAVYYISGFKGNVAKNGGGICSRCGIFIKLTDIFDHAKNHHHSN